MLRSLQSINFIERILWLYQNLTAEHYVQEMLCCSSSLILTMYGLRLKDNIHLEIEMPPSSSNITASVSRRCQLNWQKVLPYDGAFLLLTEHLEESTFRLKATCL